MKRKTAEAGFKPKRAIAKAMLKKNGGRREKGNAKSEEKHPKLTAGKLQGAVQKSPATQKSAVPAKKPFPIVSKSLPKLSASTTSKLESIFGEVSRQITPTAEESKREKEFALSLCAKLGRALAGEGVKVFFVGSTARDTGLRGDRDIDLFAAFPQNRERDYIVAQTFAAVKREIPGNWATHYAEHPYLQASLGDYKVEVIPCFQIRPHERTKSAVDRSPLHMDYLQKRLSPMQKRDVRVLKQLLKAAGIYGAESRVGGFSGLICEYLILNYRSLAGLLAEATAWRPPVVVDIEGVGGENSEVLQRFKDSPLILIDAIDSKRNAAAAISADSFATFVSLSHALLQRPAKEFFFPAARPAMGLKNAEEAIRERATSIILAHFPISANLVEDVAYPQLRRTQRSVADNVAKAGFRLVDSSEGLAQNRGFFIFEFANFSKPGVEPVQGPPAWFAKESESFLKKHPAPLRGPFVRDGRLVVEVKPQFRTAAEFVRNLLENPRGIAVGPDIAPSLKRAKVQELPKETASLDPGSIEFVSGYLAKRAHWLQ
ncbi:CCA tRNA nucleotidyltransferase [Candidatus Micrarchaeota archaeon]|nr:CCA tRNA nucleotidyltransferase [Candidatus Micrarchaeota archaeon]MBI5177487.1 CCA tRNA nucleotidyltransferase [Candidatus Micrarchaeota archaeon]